MNGTRMVRLLAILMILGAWQAIPAAAAPPWAKLMTGKQVEADPKQDYTVSKDNGPWMIMACSFRGLQAEKQAHDLAVELRKRYKIEAYVHKLQFKLDDPNGPNSDPTVSKARWKYKKYQQAQPEFEEYAVLAGNYPSADDPEGQKTLKKLKFSDPDCLKIQEGRSTARSLAALRTIQRAILPQDDEAKSKGPMGHAQMTINPLLPPDYVAPKGGVDDFVIRLNAGVPHCLLDCPGKYTVQVAHFTGNVELDQRKIQAIESGDAKSGSGEKQSKLGQAAEKADTLARALRIKGYEAYQFHDHNASIVTVGSFESVGMPRDDGKIEINPKIHAIMQAFGADAIKTPAGVPAGTIASVPKQMESVGIFFDVQPIPVQVPKRSISRELARKRDLADN